MNVNIQESDGKLVATLAGEMDTAAAAAAEKVLSTLYESDGKDVVIDCTDLLYIASSGLRILLAILKASKAAGATVTLRHVNHDIMNVLELTGFISVFEFDN